MYHTGFGLIALGLSEFHLVELSKSFEDAKTYCRDMYSDFATVHNLTDMSTLIALATDKSVQRAWIGLEIGKEQLWHWTWPDQMVDFLNWNHGNPLNNDEDACAAMDEKGGWFESACGTRRSFVCHGELSVIFSSISVQNLFHVFFHCSLYCCRFVLKLCYTVTFVLSQKVK